MNARQFFERYWFLLGMATAIAVGMTLPEGGAWLRESGVVLPALVAFTLLMSGFTLDTSRLLGQAANVRAIALTLSTTYVVAPALAYLCALLFGPPVDGPDSAGAHFLEATMISAAQAGTLASALALTAVARGDQELALVLTVLSNALTAVLTPLVLRLSIGEEVSFPVVEMMGRMSLVVIAPVILGQLLRRVLWSRAARVLPVVRILPRLIILAFLYTGFSAAASHLLAEPLLAAQFLGAGALLHILLLVWTYTASTALRFSANARVAIVLCGSQKTLPNGIYLWEQFFRTNPYGALPLVLYHVFQLVVDTLIVPWIDAEKDSPDSASPPTSDSCTAR
jgi:sodium/bile acid cotransporter 7